MKCNKIRKMIHGYIDDALGPDGRFAVEWHLETCPACRKYFQEMADVRENLRGLGAVKAPAVLHFMLKSRVRFSTPRPSPAWFLPDPFRLLGVRNAFPWKAVAAVIPVTALLFAFSASLLYHPGDLREIIAASPGGFYSQSRSAGAPARFVAPEFDHDRMSELADAGVLNPETDHLDLAALVNPAGNVEFTYISGDPRNEEKVRRILDSAVLSPAVLNGRKVGTLFVLSVERVRAES